MDEDRADRIRRIAAKQVAVCKDFAQHKAASSIQITDEDWEAIEVLREDDHSIRRKKPNTNYTFNTCGRVKVSTKKRIALERKIKEAGMTIAEWREFHLPKVVKKPNSVLIKKSASE